MSAPSDILVSEVSNRRTSGAANKVPPGERINVRVAVYLQEHPGQQVRVGDIADKLGLTSEQVSTVLQKFQTRPDVERVERGVYVYWPGRTGKPVTTAKPPTVDKPVIRAVQKMEPKTSPYIPAGIVYQDIPGAVDKLGRQVVRRHDGHIFAVEAL